MKTDSLKEKIRRTAKKLYIIKNAGGICEHCGDDRFYVLHFHHTKEDKLFNVGGKRGGRLSTMEHEANKCILLCANCHQKHHMKNLNVKKSRNTSKKILLEYKNSCGCVRCGEDNDRILNFHHERDKEFSISNAINNLTIKCVDDIPERIKLELDKCIVLCPNCHFEEHYDIKFFEEYYDEIIRKSENLKEIQKPLDRELVKSMSLSGMKQNQIAKHFNASKGTINDILNSFGMTTPISDILVDKKRLVELNLEGKTNTEIQNELECSRTTIQLILSKNDLKYNKDKDPDKCKHRRKFDPTPEELYKLLETNSYGDLGKLYGVSRIAVFKRKQKFDKMINK